MKISVLENEKVVERIQLDLSGLLFIQTQVQVRKVSLFKFIFSKLGDSIVWKRLPFCI